jgi:lipopolysaccharide cholinephosphotransferase
MGKDFNLEAEEICGHYVTEDVKKLWAVQLDLLDQLRIICQKHNIKYFAGGGTLLGVIRHKGFIPWDDDIDVVMPEEDYRRFLDKAESHLPNDVFLQCERSDNTWNLPWSKLRDAYSSCYTNERELLSGCHVGISLDIFCWKKYLHDKPGFFFTQLQEITKRAAWYSKQKNNKSFLIRIFRPFAKLCLYMCRLCWGVADNFWWRAKYWGIIPEVGSIDRFYRYHESLIFPLTRIAFEDAEFYAPANPHEILRLRYGDKYMEPPHEGWKVAHNGIIKPFQKCKHPRALIWPK